jgi:hypothetical protein
MHIRISDEGGFVGLDTKPVQSQSKYRRIRFAMADKVRVNE